MAQCAAHVACCPCTIRFLSYLWCPVAAVRHMQGVGQQQLQQLVAAGGGWAPPNTTAGGAGNQQQGQLLAPTVDEAAVVIHTPSAAVTPEFKFGFHKPPFRSIDHLQ
jgi:hypothetical protein